MQLNEFYKLKNVRTCMAAKIPVWADGVLGHADCAFLHTPKRQPSDLVL